MANFGDFTRYTQVYDEATADVPAEAGTFTWFGAEIRIRGEIGLMPLMRFSAAASRGLNSDDIEGLAALYRVLESSIDERDWSTFRDLAEENNIDGDVLVDVVGGIIAELAGRPTKRLSDSSDGQPTASSTSRPVSSSPVAVPRSVEEKVAADLGIPLPPETRPDLRASLRLVDEPIAEAS